MGKLPIHSLPGEGEGILRKGAPPPRTRTHGVYAVMTTTRYGAESFGQNFAAPAALHAAAELSRPATSSWCPPEAVCTKTARNRAGRHFAQAVAAQPHCVRVPPQCGSEVTPEPEIRQRPSQHSVEPRSRPKLALARKETIYREARAWGQTVSAAGSLRSQAHARRTAARPRAYP